MSQETALSQFCANAFVEKKHETQILHSSMILSVLLIQGSIR